MAPPPPKEGSGNPAASAAGLGGASDVNSPFLEASTEQQSTSDQADRATTIDVGKPLPKSVAPLNRLHADDDDDYSSGTESDSSFGSRLLDHDGER